MKKSRLIIMTLLTIPMLVGCGRKKAAAGSYEITIWDDKSNLTVLTELCNRFQADLKLKYKNAPTLSFKFVSQPEKSAIEKMTSGIAESGNGPDIVAVTHDTLASGKKNKVISEVMYPEVINERMTKEAVTAVTVDGKMYGYPVVTESQVLFYDKSRISESDVGSFESIFALGKKIGMQITGDNGGYYSWCLYKDSVLFGEDGTKKTEVNLATPKSVANVLKFYQNYTGLVDDNTPEVTVNYFDTNPKFVGLISSPFILSTIKNKIPDYNLGIAPVPTLNGESVRPFSGYKAYAVSYYSVNPTLCHALANYLATYTSMAYRIQEQDYLPACNLDATTDIEELIDASDYCPTYKESLLNSIPMPAIEEMANFWTQMNNVSKTFKQKGGSLTESEVVAALTEAGNNIRGH